MVAAKDGRVKLGIEAPQEVSVNRLEVEDRKKWQDMRPRPRNGGIRWT